jgi:uncharacterized protein (TIGR02996 family)
VRCVKDSDDTVFLAAIATGDDTARLVYADWLDENGDPRRAEYVRFQVCRLSGATEDDTNDPGERERWLQDEAKAENL